MQTTWEINFQAVEKEAQRPGTAGMCSPELLKFCAFLAPDDIPLDLVRCGSKEYCPALYTLFQQAEDEAEAEEIYNEVLEPLTRYSLVVKNLEARTFGLHRLVQAVTRDRLADKQREWQERAVRAVAAAFPVPEIENRRLCARLLPHALVVEKGLRGEKSDNRRRRRAGKRRPLLVLTGPLRPRQCLLSIRAGNRARNSPRATILTLPPASTIWVCCATNKRYPKKRRRLQTGAGDH